MKKSFKIFLAVLIIITTYNSILIAEKRTVPFKVLYNHDGTYMGTCSHPWKEPKQSWTPSMLTASVEELAGIGIDAVAFNPGNGVIPWWQSEMYADHWDWYMNRTGKTVKHLSSWGKYMYQGGDMVKDFVDACRKTNIIPNPINLCALCTEHGKPIE